MATNFDIEVFASSSSTKTKVAIGGIRNLLVKALKENNKFPKYIIIVPEVDIIDEVDFDQKIGISEVYGHTLKWLADEIHAIITQQKDDLPICAKKYLYPQGFEVELPQHKGFHNSQF